MLTYGLPVVYVAKLIQVLLLDVHLITMHITFTLVHLQHRQGRKAMLVKDKR